MTATPDILDRAEVPFDAARADRLMEEAGIDVLLATSKHNTRYLLGGYGFIFFSAMDAIGHSRYLPIVIYAKGRPEHAAYVANRMERAEHANRPFWTPTFHPSAWGTLDAAADAVEHLKTIGQAEGAHRHRAGLPALGRAGAARRAAGWGTLRRRDRGAGAAAGDQDAGRAGEAAAGLGVDHRLDADDHRLGARGHDQGRDHRAAAAGGNGPRGLHFDYCLLTLGAGHNRAPSAQAWRPGEVAVDRFGRQLRWLHRRSRAHGRAR